MLPYKFRLNSVEDVNAAKQSPNPTRSSLGFVRSFSRESFCELLETLYTFIVINLTVAGV